MKKASLKSIITINNAKYEYKIEQIHNEATYLECQAAGIAREFLNDDIPRVIVNLPNLIIKRQKADDSKDYVLRFRVSAQEKEVIEQKAVNKGYKTVSAFIKDAIFLF